MKKWLSGWRQCLYEIIITAFFLTGLSAFLDYRNDGSWYIRGFVVILFLWSLEVFIQMRIEKEKNSD